MSDPSVVSDDAEHLSLTIDALPDALPDALLTPLVLHNADANREVQSTAVQAAGVPRLLPLFITRDEARALRQELQLTGPAGELEFLADQRARLNTSG